MSKKVKIKNIVRYLLIIVGVMIVLIYANQSSNAQIESDIRVVAWNHDGTKLAAGYDDGTIRIWDVSSQQIEFTLQESTEIIRSLAWSPDGTILASGGYDNMVRIWNTSIGLEIATLSGHTDPVRSIIWSSDGSTLITQGIGVNDQLNQRVWNATSLNWEPVLAERGIGIVDMAYSPDEKKIALASSGAQIDIADPSDLQVLGTITYPEGVGHAYDVYTVAWSPDGTRVVGGSLNGAVRVWDITDVSMPQMLFDLKGNEQAEIDPNASAIAELRYSETGNTLMAISADGTVRLWDADTGEVLQTLPLGASLHGAALSPDGRELAYGDLSNDVEPEIVCFAQWDIPDRQNGTFRLTPCSRDIVTINWSSSGAMIASGHFDRKVRIWDANTNQLLHTLSGHTEYITSLAWSPDESLVAAGSADKTVHVWNVNTGGELFILSGHTSTVTAIIWSLDGTEIITIGLSGLENLRVYDSNTGTLISASGIGGGIKAIWNPDESILGVANVVGIVEFLDAASLEQISMIEVPNWEEGGMDADFYAMAWQPNGGHIATGSLDGTVRIWDIDTQTILFELQGNDSDELAYDKGAVVELRYSESGDTLMSISTDGTIRSWNANTGEVMQTTQLGATLYDAALSPDGCKLTFGVLSNGVEPEIIGV